MEPVSISDPTAEQWNAFVAKSPHFALTQSYEWGEFKECLGWKAVRVAVTQQNDIVAGAQMLIRPLPLRLGSVVYIPRGPLLDWRDTLTATTLLDTIHRIARQHYASFLRIEPSVLHSPDAHLMLQQYGFQAAMQTNQPQCTLVLDLEADVDALFAGLPKKTRYHIRACRRKGITIRQGEENDLATFYSLMKMTAQRKSFPIRSQEYYKQEFKAFAPHNCVALFLADYQGETIAAEMPFVFNQHGAAFHGASSNTHRRVPASDLLTWEGIKWAKEQNCRIYDLWGIPDKVGQLVAAGKPIPKDKQGGMWGVYYFKKGFGGDIVYYIGAYDYVYVKPMYAGLTKILSWLESSRAFINFIDRIEKGGI